MKKMKEEKEQKLKIYFSTQHPSHYVLTAYSLQEAKEKIYNYAFKEYIDKSNATIKHYNEEIAKLYEESVVWDVTKDAIKKQMNHFKEYIEHEEKYINDKMYEYNNIIRYLSCTENDIIKM